MSHLRASRVRVPSLERMATVALLAGALLAPALLAAGELIETVDYSDTFTLGVNSRANGVFGAGAIDAYAVEDTHGNPPATWAPQTNFSFNDIPGSFGNGPTVLAAAAGNPGAEGGVAQSGGGDFSFTYGLRTNYIVEVDAFVSPGDRTDISSLPNAGDTIFAANSLSVFFRRDSIGANSIGLFNGSVETAVVDENGDRVLIGVDDDDWHRLAVHFNQDEDRLVISVDGEVKADLDLTTFAGGIYKDYSNGAVGAGGAGAFVEGKVLWFDNFRVGAPSTTVFADDFERPDAPVDGWTPFRGDWNISGGRAVTGPTDAEHWLWAGDPPVSVPENVEISFDMEFLSAGTVPAIGRHAGLMFFANEPTERFAPSSNGYVLWWIDRQSDFGISLARFDGNAFTFLQEGSGDAVADPPRQWRIVVQGPSIKVYGDEVLYVDVVDDTYRGGLVGLWTWAGGQEVAFDDVVIRRPDTGAAVSCFDVLTGEPILAGSPVSLDGSCSQSIGGGDIVSYAWDFGDGESGEGSEVAHEFPAGVFTVTLTVTDSAGNEASSSRDITVADPVLEYADDFARPDGEVSGWSPFAGGWHLAGEKLATGPTDAENWIWAGAPAVAAPGNTVFEYDWSFLAPGTVPAVGRHGGFQFHCDRPTARTGGGAFSGYFVDWIDRDADRGVRLTRVDAGAFNELVRGQGADAPAEPPSHYRVEVDGASIRVFGDDVLYIDVVDDTYRGGYFGFWTWTGGQEVEIDNLTVSGKPLTACFTSDPEVLLDGVPVTLDATCSGVFAGLGEVVSYAWDLGDGTSATGPVVEHTYMVPDRYTVTLTVEDDSGAQATTERILTVSENLVPMAQCFETDPGPVAGWTAPLGEWLVSRNGRLQTSTTTGAPDAEAWVYPGDPPGVISGDFSLSFDVPSALFTGPPGDAVGRHFGVYFFGNTVTTNRFAADSSGYTFWWIDRASDFGLNLARWDGPALTVLHQGTGDLFQDPPQRWRIEVEGEMIRLYGDGVLAIEVADDTYRAGHFGFWAWKNMTLQIDNVVSPSSRPPATCDIDLTCTVTASDPAALRIEASTTPPDFCGAPEECGCDMIEASLDGVSLGTFALEGGALVREVPLPPECEPGTEHELTVHCLADTGPGADASCTFVCPEPPGGLQRPGDCNQDGTLDISDASCLFGFLFLGTPGELPCGDGTGSDVPNVALMDTNGDNGVDLSDGVSILLFLFSGGPPPEAGEACIRIPGCPDACTE